MDFDVDRAVRARWPTAESFYAERDDRTVRAVGAADAYAGSPVQIWLDPAFAHTPGGQRLLIVAANLMARWARQIHVAAPDTRLVEQLVRDGHNTLRERVLSEMRLADPFGSFSWADIHTAAPDPGSQDPLRLFLGPWEAGASEMSEEDFTVDASGWTTAGTRGAGIEWSLRRPASLSAIGLAASLGVADVFKRAIGHARGDWIPGFAWCSHGHRLGSSPADVGDAGLQVADTLQLDRTLVAGVGAIGSALVYLADLGDVEGTVALLDRDTVECSNLNRSPLFSVLHVLHDVAKVEACAAFLVGRKCVRTAQYDGTWVEQVDRVQDGRFDRWISLTNEHGAWATVPFLSPPVVVHATTTSGWGFGAGWHIPGSDDCTYCRMPRPESEFRGPCAEGVIEQPAAEFTRAALPFLSVAAASLLLGELQKLADPSYAAGAGVPNHITADLRMGLPAVVAMRRRANPTCPGCRAACVTATQL